MYDTPLYLKYNWGFKFAKSAYYQYKTRNRMAWGKNFQSDYAKMRSFVPNTSSASMRLETRLREMNRKINKNKPETKHYFDNYGSNIILANTTTRIDKDITTEFHQDPDFRENVLGDKWRNLSLEVRLRQNGTPFTTGAVRLVVYKPKRPGSVWPGVSLIQMIDPNDHTVLFDQYVPIHAASATQLCLLPKHYKINLRNTITSYDTLIRKGDIKLALLCQAGSTGYTMDINILLKYQNI